MIKHILVIRNDRFGEFLLNIPAIRALKEMHPQARLSLAVSSAVCELAGAIECVDEILVWDAVKRSLRKYKFEFCVVLNPTKEAHWAVFWAGIPKRVGYDRKWGFLLTHKLEDTKHLGDRHEVDCNLELVSLIGAKTLDKTVKIKVDDKLFREFIVQDRGQSPSGTVPFSSDKYEFLEGAIAIHPFTSDPVKQWPVERFRELAQRIKRELGLKVVMVGLSQSALDVGDEIVNMINKTSLVELAALLKRCSLLVSCDSGPMHLAASVGTPVIALFRNDLSGKTSQRWGPWGEGHTVIEKSNLLDISVEEVFGVVKRAVN